MKIYQETNDFYEIKDLLWSGAEDTLQTIEDNDKFDAFDDYINELYPDGIGLTSLNDMLRFDGDQILKDLGIVDDEKLTQMNNLADTIYNSYKSVEKDKEGIINQIRFDDGDVEEATNLLNALDSNVRALNAIGIDNDTDFMDLEEAAYNIYTDLEAIEDYSSDLGIICNSARELESLAQDAQ